MFLLLLLILLPFSSESPTFIPPVLLHLSPFFPLSFSLSVPASCLPRFLTLFPSPPQAQQERDVFEFHLCLSPLSHKN